MNIREVANGTVIENEMPLLYKVGFNENDETELDACDLNEHERIWKALCSEFKCNTDSVSYVERWSGDPEEEIITSEMLQKGYEAGLVKFIENPVLSSGTVCEIGNYWFLFNVERDIDESPDEFLKNTSLDVALGWVKQTLDEFRTAKECLDEYRYYYCYLMENLRRG